MSDEPKVVRTDEEAIVEVLATLPTPAVAPVKPVLPVVVPVSKSKSHFAASPAAPEANKWGIVNGRGEVVTTAYLKAYVECSCRIPDGYVKDRVANMQYLMSDAFMSACKADKLTAAQVGKRASVDPRWGLAKKVGKVPTVTVVNPTVVEGPLAAIAEAAGITAPPAPEIGVVIPKSMTKKEAHEYAKRILDEQEKRRKESDRDAADKAAKLITEQIAALDSGDPAAAVGIAAATVELKINEALVNAE